MVPKLFSSLKCGFATAVEDRSRRALVVALFQEMAYQFSPLPGAVLFALDTTAEIGSIRMSVVQVMTGGGY